MLYLLSKALLSGMMVLVVSELAKRSPAFGALVASLPLVSVLAMMWLEHETRDTGRIAAHAEATFWYVLPSLPMFLLLPFMLRSGVGFYPTLLVCIVLTALLYVGMSLILSRFGLSL